jgi:dienelactone hydrolase
MIRFRLILIAVLWPFALAASGESVTAQSLPDTLPLTETRALDEWMVTGIDEFALREITTARQQRPAPHDHSKAERQAEFSRLIGVVDARAKADGIELIHRSNSPSLVASNDLYEIHRVRWPALDGINAEGLWLKPRAQPVMRVVAIADADWSPEMIAGLSDCDSKFAADLAMLGCEVLVPVLIDRNSRFSGNPAIGKATNLSHREFIYRMAFEVGRHVIGYEVQKVLAAVDQLELRNRNEQEVPIAVVGVGEGGLLALYSAAIDDRIDATLVSGYFDQREQVWREPIYRNVWRLLPKFGDAELATLIAPAKLHIEPAPRVPTVFEPPAGERSIAAPGSIQSPACASVQQEVERAKALWSGESDPREPSDWLRMVSTTPGQSPLATETLRDFAEDVVGRPLAMATIAEPTKKFVADEDRQQRQVAEMVEFTQRVLRHSHRVRDEQWDKIGRSTLDTWCQSVAPRREAVYEELIGRLPDPTIDPRPRSRQVIDEPDFVGYEVVLDVYPDVIAAGLLLLPKGLLPAEKRPVVVCQHGLEGTPQDTIGGPQATGYRSYQAFSRELVRRGFIVYAPQNPYRGEDRFRTIQRKSNPLGRSLFSYIIPQHLVTLRWLSSLPNVDRNRIGFYGLSYGGKTAMRVPPFLVPSETEPGYCLSICSADFNEWVSKNASVDAPFSYLWTGEYEIFEWNMAHVANYAELAMLISPRPFMVERGHDDGVGIDEWVAAEYAKVRRHYNKLGIGDRTEIEFFDGPHTINGQGTYEFLHRHLAHPQRKRDP